MKLKFTWNADSAISAENRVFYRNAAGNRSGPRCGAAPVAIKLHRSENGAMRGTILVGLLVAAMFGGWAPDLAAAGEVLESRFYTIHHNLPERQVRKYARHMDLIFAEYTRRFSGLRDRRKGRMNLYLLKTREDYLRQLGSFGIDGSASGGMFFWGPRGSGLATWTAGRSEATVFGILQHEGLHQFARNYLGEEIPIWLNEGLAEYFEQAQIIRGKVKLGIAEPWRIARLKSAIESGDTFDFHELLNISSQRWRANMQTAPELGSLQYTQSWSIVYFLIHGDKGKYRGAFQKYLDQLSNGRTHEMAFRTAFGSSDTRKFHRRWEQFVRKHLKPDHYSVALQRMSFLAEGMTMLLASDEPMPESIEALRAALSSREFAVTYRGHGGERILRATDALLYEYEDRQGHKHPFVLTQSASDLPPSLRAPRLRPMPVLEWEQVEEEQLQHRIRYQ